MIVRLAACLLAAGALVARGAAFQELLPVSNDAAIDDTGAGRAFVEVEAPDPAPFARVPARVVVRVGLEREFRRGALVQLFSRALDVPAQVQLPWSAELGDTLHVVLAPAGAGPTLALDEEIVHARDVGALDRDGRTWDVFELDLRVVASAPRDVELAPVLVRFAYATRFDDDFVRGRVPVDRVDAYVRSLPLVLHVRGLPDANRPADFTGGAGRFTVRAEAAPRELAVGDEVHVELHVDGTGDFASFTPPRLDRVAGFQVRGVRDELSAAGRAITYDLVVTDERVTQVPAIPLSFFDPETGAYATVRTDAIPLRVSASTAPRDAEANEGAPRSSNSTWIGGITGAVAGAIASVVVLNRARRRQRAANAPERVRAREAAATFRARLDEPGVDPGLALSEYLSAALGRPASAFVGSDPAPALVAAGVDAELARRTARLLDELVAARYGGAAPRDGSERTRVLGEELARAFDARV